MMHKFFIFVLAWCLSGCSLLIRPATQHMASNISEAILNQNDPETVAQALPAYLILLDAFLLDDREQIKLLLSGSKLNGSYASYFVKNPDRRKRLSEKAFKYAQTAFCLTFNDSCKIYEQPFDQYQQFLCTVDEDEVPVLYGFAIAWANWVQIHSDDWMAKADLPKVKATLQTVIALDERYQNGEPQVYLGVLDSLLPPALGGKPEQAKAYFERALVLSSQQNLMFKVIYAERYARLVFDRALHDKLLQSVLKANPDIPGLTLANTLAQQQAKRLLESGDDYF